MKTLSKITAIAAALTAILTADCEVNEWMGYPMVTIAILTAVSYAAYFKGSQIKNFFTYEN